MGERKEARFWLAQYSSIPFLGRNIIAEIGDIETRTRSSERVCLESERIARGGQQFSRGERHTRLYGELTLPQTTRGRNGLALPLAVALVPR